MCPLLYAIYNIVTISRAVYKSDKSYLIVNVYLRYDLCFNIQWLSTAYGTSYNFHYFSVTSYESVLLISWYDN